MFLCAVNFSARCAGLAAFTALGLSASAQQSIQFSKPANQDPTTAANSFQPPSHKSPSAFNAPSSSLFGQQGPSVDFDVLPGGPAPIYPNANGAQWQKVLQDRKNWGLMTPAQILGVPTPESILGIADPLEDPNASPEERYLQRQDRDSEMTATNGLHRPSATRLQNDDRNPGQFQDWSDNGRLADTPGSLGPGSINSGQVRNTSPFWIQNSGTPSGVNQKLDPTWASPFGTPEPLPKATPEQLAGMEDFRALLDREPPQKLPASANYYSPAPAPANPFLQSGPGFNPAGHAFTPVLNDIAKPTGLAPLAGVTGPLPAPAKKPALVDPPPWMSPSSLQNPTMPQRQF